MDKITLPLTKDVDQKVIGSVVEEPTKGMLVAIPTVVILMLLFIPDESSHWTWMGAWFLYHPRYGEQLKASEQTRVAS